MAENSNIEWTDHTFNPWIGCTKVSPACKHCYAERDFDHRLQKAKWGPNGTRRVTSTANWNKVWRWDESAEADGVRRRVFCASLADVFEDWKGTMHGPNDEVVQVAENGMVTFGDDGIRVATMADVRRDLFRVIDATPHLDWLLLTKRPENIRRMMSLVRLDGGTTGRIAELDIETPSHPYFRRNVWIGTSVENQEQADKRIPELLQCRRLSPVLFLSCEPLLGPLNLQRLAEEKGFASPGIDGVDWVIAGGESGPLARPSHPDWFRSLRDQCERSGTPFHFKQWGEWIDKSQPSYQGQPFGDNFGLLAGDGQWSDKTADTNPIDDEAVMVRIGKKKAGRLLDGVEHDGVPHPTTTEVIQ